MILNAFSENVESSCLVFCEIGKNKDMIINYVRSVDQIKEEMMSCVDDEFEGDNFNLGNDFMRFKFRTDGNLVYNQKINIKVFVISLSNVIKRGSVYYLQFKLQKCFYEKENF